MILYLLMSLGPAVGACLLLNVVPHAEVAGAIGIAAAVLLFVVGEAVVSHNASIDPGAIRHDIVHAVLSSATAQLCLFGAVALLSFVDREPLGWPVALQVACIVIGSDFLGYWAHRAQHRVRILWAPHALHHSPQELYWLNGLRAHPGDTAWIFAISTVWVLVAGFSLEAFAIGSVVLTSHLLLQHTRVRFPEWLEAIFVTPAWHRIHHDPGTASVNLGKILTVWDRWFGTYRSSDPPPAALGIAEENPESLLQELTLPWTILKKR